MNNKNLARVTLCCVTSTNRPLSERALLRSARHLPFGRVAWFSDLPPTSREIDHVAIAPLASLADYNRFVLSELGRHIDTDFALLIQYDGFLVNPQAWTDEFLQYDYIGARWPWHGQYQVGNGGFSLRSARLLQATGDALFGQIEAAEDELIGRLLRSYLEVRHAIRFAPAALADVFSVEHARVTAPSLGFHGLFHFHDVLDDAGLTEAMALLDEATFAGGNALLWFLAMRRTNHPRVGELAGRVRRAQPAPVLERNCSLYGLSPARIANELAMSSR